MQTTDKARGNKAETINDRHHARQKDDAGFLTAIISRLKGRNARGLICGLAFLNWLRHRKLTTRNNRHLSVVIQSSFRRLFSAIIASRKLFWITKALLNLSGQMHGQSSNNPG